MAKFIQDRVARVPSQNVRSTGGFVALVLGGAHWIGVDSAQFQNLDGGGSHRDVNLPPPLTSVGAWFRICNKGGTHTLVVKKPDTTTLVTIAAGDTAVVFCSGFDWAFS